MKHLFTFMAAAAISLSALGAAPADTTVYFTVSPAMHCANCEQKIKSNLRFEKGVKAIDASASKGIIAVKFNPSKNSVERLTKALAKIGYKATAATPPKKQ